MYKVPLREKDQYSLTRPNLCLRQPQQQANNWNSEPPGGPYLGPYVFPVQSPRREQNDHFVRSLQRIQDDFLEICSGINVSLIEKDLSAARFDLSGDLLSDPCVGAAVADEYQPFLRLRPIFHLVYLTTIFSTLWLS